MQIMRSIIFTCLSLSLLVCLCFGMACFGMAAPGFAATDDLTADELTIGAEVFEGQCAGCHVGGGNIIRRGKTLKLKALEKNQMDSLEAIQTIVTQGKGNMSAYGDRLSPAEINAVAAYVLAQAAQNWPTP
jgi:cytochrome c6